MRSWPSADGALHVSYNSFSSVDLVLLVPLNAPESGLSMPPERRPSLCKQHEPWYCSPFAAPQGRNWVSARKQTHAVHFNVCQQVLRRCLAGRKEGFTVKAPAVNVTACSLILPARLTRKNMLLVKHVESFQPEENKLFPQFVWGIKSIWSFVRQKQIQGQYFFLWSVIRFRIFLWERHNRTSKGRNKQLWQNYPF